MHDQLKTLLLTMIDKHASDLHLAPGYPPVLRVHGELVPHESASIDDVGPLLETVVPSGGMARLVEKRDLDFAVQIETTGKQERFRVNAFHTRGRLAACFRHIPGVIPELEQLGFPVELADRIAGVTSGLVLVTGITGSGKSTSLAMLVKRMADQGGRRIITIEEPIEYLFPGGGASMVTQREVGSDVATFHDGLRFGLRQDPDILLVGEIRDRETAQLALSAAETGHLILSTLHTADAKGAITRLVDLFPSEQHSDVRTQLAMSLKYVVTQHLLPPVDGVGKRVLALEVLAANFAVRSAIRVGKIESLDSAIQSGRRDGMVSLDAHLRSLLQDGRIDMQTARLYASDPGEF